MASTAAEPPLPKRRRRTYGGEDALIEGLPDHIAEICLSRVRCPSLLSAVCSRWRRLVYSPNFPPFLCLYVLFVDPDPSNLTSSVRFMSFDPVSSRWDPLPPGQPDPTLSRLLYRHPSFISFNLPVQTVSASGKLVLLAGTSRELFPALSHPVVFDPVSCTWTSGPPLDAPRRWCAAGTYGGAVYVASGTGSQFSPDVARSIEKWDVNDRRGWRRWERLRDLKDGRFSREAIDAVGWKGKLLMVNVKGDALKEGAIYDVVKDRWEGMPEAMVAGWRGPVAAMAEETLYAVDETKGSVRRYDEERGEWGEVVVEADERLKGAQQVAAVAGKLCVVTGGSDGGGGRIVVVDVEAAPAKIWTVESPEGLEPVAAHVLPRMSRPGFC